MLAGLLLAPSTGSLAQAGGAPPRSSSTGGPNSPYVNGLLSTDTGLPSSAVNPRDVGLYDPYGRYIFLHGVNAVYKRPPFELYVDPGKPWNFDDQDAKLMAALGFNMVRLGILWEGIEPGKVGPNDPRICTKGKPGDPGQWNQAVADRYIQRVVQTVNLLGRYHIYSMIDMHQDVYDQVFHGEGAPPWAVCTDGIPITTAPGRWSNNYGTPAAFAAFRNFWQNAVIGNLQGEYDRSWAAVASALAGNTWVAGYDPINEPFTPSINQAEPLDTELECFYTGRAHRGEFGGKPLNCPPQVPERGVIPSIQAQDPHHMLFLEPTVFEVHGQPNFLGGMPFPNLVLNFHAYCGARSPVTGNPYAGASCVNEIERRFIHRELQVAKNPSSYQPDGMPLFLSEFGATQSAALVAEATSTANLLGLGWAYWSWKYYDDPTGSSKEALISPTGQLGPQAGALEQVYPEAVAGTVLNYLYEYTDRDLYLTYYSDPRVTAPTLVFIPPDERSSGYCADVHGATVISAPNAGILEVKNDPHSPEKVQLAVSKGRC